MLTNYDNIAIDCTTADSRLPMTHVDFWTMHADDFFKWLRESNEALLAKGRQNRGRTAAQD